MNSAELFDLSGKVAVITGAAGLLGKQHAAVLAGANAALVITDLDHGAAVAAAAALHAEYGVPALGRGADITNPKDVDSLCRAVLDAFGRIDVLVNNAAIDDKFTTGQDPAQSRFESYAVEQFRRVLDVNVTGTFLCCQRFGTEMLQRGGGSIINVASTYGIVAPDQSLYRKPDGAQDFWKSAAYPTSKAAVIHFTRFLACYWGPHRVRVNALSPGGVYTNQSPEFRSAYAARTPLGRMAQASDYRGALLFLASDAAAYVTGANLVVDGGFTAW